MTTNPTTPVVDATDTDQHHHEMPTAGGAVVHATGVHGGLSPRVVGIVAAVAFVFGTSVLAAEIFDTDEPAHDDGHGAIVTPPAEIGVAQDAGVA